MRSVVSDAPQHLRHKARPHPRAWRGSFSLPGSLLSRTEKPRVWVRALCGHSASYESLKVFLLILALPLTRPKASDNFEGLSLSWAIFTSMIPFSLRFCHMHIIYVLCVIIYKLEVFLPC